jgi:hypothetical protein
VGGEPQSVAPAGVSRFSLFERGRWGIVLAAAATIVAAAPPVATAAAPSRQGRMPSPENGRHRRYHPPSQAEITRVIDENRSSITVCYQRAVARDNRLTDGKIAVKLSIGISGRVKNVNIDGLVQFRSVVEPCIKEAVARWSFPQASEEYGTEFPYVFLNDYVDEDSEDACAITVNTVPWSEVWVDGKSTTRHTPLVGWKLPCGTHKLSFKRPDMGIDRTETISLPPRHTFKQRYSLTTDDARRPRD